MKHTRYFTAALLLSFSVGTTSALAENEVRSMGELEYIATETPEPVIWRGASLMMKKSAPTPENIRFSALPSDRLEKVKEANSTQEGTLRAKPLQIGVNRFFSMEAETKTQPVLNWQEVDGGSVASLTVTSPEAASLRVGIKITQFPTNAELRFSGSDDPENIIGTTSGQEVLNLRSDNDTYWTPMTDGETQTIELFIPNKSDLENIDFNIDAVSHIFVSAIGGFDTTKVQKASDSCEINVACKHSELGTAFQNAIKAVAKMTFTESGKSYLCTGTLLNNSKQDYTPYFWSAAHCFNNQTVANTLNTFWFYEASSCYGSSASSTKLTGGAELLHVNNAADTLLLKLKNSAPSGSVFAGWNSSSFSSGSVVAIHHPQGDIKKVSIGKGEGITCDKLFSPDPPVNNAMLDLVSWQQGTTEGGSSGSGLFTLSGSTYQLRGGLMGGAASCSNSGQSYSSGNADCYSSLNRVWSSIKPHLSPETTNTDLTPSHDYRGMWYKTGEGGWGLTIDQYSYGSARNPYLYVAWYTYDASGKARWLLFQGDWTAKDKLTAEVRQYTGSAWSSSFNTSNIKYNVVGTATITFTSATTANLTYNVDGVSRTVTVSKSQ